MEFIGNREITFRSKFVYEDIGQQVTPEGIDQIARYIYENVVCKSEHGSTYRTWLVEYPGWTWEWVITEKGSKYKGTLPKRLARFMHDEHNASLSVEQLSHVGNIARKFAQTDKVYIFDFDDKISWPAGMFGDGGSCLWDGRNGAKLMIKEHGGCAFRMWDSTDPMTGRGRCWIAPITDLKDEQRFAMFNAYSSNNVTLVTMARIVASWAGLSYKRVDIRNNGETCGTLYLNGGSAYLLGQDELIKDKTIVNIDWDTINSGRETCIECGKRSYAENSLFSIHGPVCYECKQKGYYNCSGCKLVTKANECITINCVGRYCPTCSQHLITLDSGIYLPTSVMKIDTEEGSLTIPKADLNLFIKDGETYRRK